MKRLLTLLIVLALLSFAAFKGATWWLADQRLAEARLALDDYGLLERGTIGSGLDGRLLLTNARWQDFRLTQPLESGRVEFDARSPLALLTVLADPRNLPPEWSLRAEGLGLVLDATMLRNWVTAEGTNVEGDPALLVLPCAPDPRQQLGSGDLMRMGITGLAGELLVEQTNDRVYAELNTAGTGSLEVDWPGGRVDLVTPEDTLASSDAPMAVTLRDGGLMRRIAAYCSREAGLDTMEWARRATGALEQGLSARGLAASEQLLALYRQWLLEGGELNLAIEPSEPWLGIPVRDPGAEGQEADWQVAYNGAGVPDVYLEVLPSEPELVDEASEPSPGTREDPAVAGWYAEPVAAAGSWVGRRVRVTLSNDNVVEGRLVSVSERELEVARVVAGGEVAYPMLLSAVSGFEVWRRGRRE
ncbi:MAG: acetylornithine deacetylase [Marinobacter sp.]|uniref:acetylornithine deacetylase n=1 Tax=Marinobacter sp. TaxID=50741 RepID=UPI00396DB4A5